MLQKTHNRIIFGAIIGAFGGSSFVLSIYPVAIGRLFEQLSGNALLLTFIYSIPLAILWAVGGGLTGWLGKMRDGAIVMGICGIISGVVISANLLSEAGGSTNIVLTGAIIGLIYGLPAGLLIAAAFRRREE